jgi:hypothetical protein
MRVNPGERERRKTAWSPRAASSVAVCDSGRRFPDGYTIAELSAIATRALANGDDYARALLREQLEHEEFSEQSHITPKAEESLLKQRAL